MIRSLLPVIFATAVLIPLPVNATQHVVYHVPLTGSVDGASSRIVSRAIDRAEHSGAAALVIEVSLAAGRFDMAQLIAANLRETSVPVYAFVTGPCAASGMFIAWATDSIYMAPDGLLDAGADVQGLTDAARRVVADSFRRAAQRRGLDPEFGAALIDERITLPGVVSAGDILALDATTAVALGVSAGTVATLDALFALLDLRPVEVIEVGNESTGVTVEVANSNWRDLRVYVVRAGNRLRLGNVTAMSTKEFYIPDGFLTAGSRFRVQAEVIGSFDGVRTEEVRVQPGLVVQWGIASVLSQSSMVFFVRN